jgi:putative salt-induced outer membrane protein YdiY
VNTPLRYRLFLLSAGLMFLLVPSADAQINIEKRRAFDVDGVAVSLTGDVSLLSGNSEAFNLTGGLRFDYRKGKHYTFLLGSARYGESSNKKYREHYFGHLRYNYDLMPRLVGELFGQAERDAFTLLQVRLLAGGGLRFRYFMLADEQRIGIFQGSTLMYEYEDLDAAKTGAHPATMYVVRWSNYLNVRLELTDRTNLINTVYVQPRLGDFDDLRILDEAVLAIALTRHLTFRTAFNLRYDSRPPGDIASTDLSLANGLTVTF